MLKSLRTSVKRFFDLEERKPPSAEEQSSSLNTDVDLVALRWTTFEASILTNEALSESYDEDEIGFISTDLSEATYSTPFELLDENTKFLDEILTDVPVWKVYHRLFKINSRYVDTTELTSKGYTDVDHFTTCRGGFMGDPLSFMQLTLQMQATINMAVRRTGNTSRERHTRPLGQGAGDDNLLIGASVKLYRSLKQSFKDCNMRVSKIDSFSKDSMTFTEQYAVRPSDLAFHNGYAKESLFGDLIYLDIIKGSILSGKSKVKTTGSHPFIGHSTALNKQIAWHPIKWVRDRGGPLLWAANYRLATGLASNMASLPIPLGGIGMALTSQITRFDDELFQKRLPYYEAILGMEFNEFLKYQLLLIGIYKANPKGKIWQNDPDLIQAFIEHSEFLSEESIQVPAYLANKGYSATRKYLRDMLGLVSLREAVDVMTRREAFQRFWNEEEVTSFLSLPMKGAKERANKVWAQIYSEVIPVDHVKSHSIQELTKQFELRTWGILFKKDHPLYLEVFGGMPSLIIDYANPDTY
jgi:hypothetical protein